MYHRFLCKFSKCPKILSRDRILQGTVEQILDVPVPEMVEQLVNLPNTVFQDSIQERTVERIADVPVPQVVEELVEVFKVQIVEPDEVRSSSLTTLTSSSWRRDGST